MRALSRIPLLLAVAALGAASAIMLGVASGAESGASRTAASPNLLLGITSDTARFQGQTGQESSVDQAFLGWGQGQTYGAPFAGLFPKFGPIPMLHLGTGDITRKESITPGEIAQGKGDSYLVAMNHAIASWGKAIYVRPLAEMNNFNAFYGGYNENGTPRDANHSPASYRKAFARTSVILHGGTPAAVNARLAKLGLPGVQTEELFPNPFPQLRLVWSPLAISLPQVAGNAAWNYYPGDAYVDVVGGDIYDVNFSAPWGGLESLFTEARKHGKPFSVPEWGLTDVDDAAFVNHMCKFLDERPAVESSIFFESKPGSRWDLGSKPKSRVAYRTCLTPLAGSFPDWAAANAAGGGAGIVKLKLTPKPATGAATPFTTTFSIDAKLTVPIQQWLLVFDDGTETGGPGAPPATVKHTYAAAGLYPATLIVFPFPPFTTANAQYYTSADVTVGATPNPVLSIVPTPDSGPIPLSVSLRIEEGLSGPISSWELIFGDGKTRDGTGAPPHFGGHTFADAGDYQVLLVVNQSNNRRYMALANVTAGGGGGGGGGGTTTTTTPGGTTIPPPTATKTGTVLVNGKPFTGGTIPFNAVVDVTKGTVTLTASVGKLKVYGQDKVIAKFKLVSGTDKGKPVVELQLQGGNFGVCPTRKTKSVGGTTATSKKVVRQVWGDGKGKFRTKGRYSSATVRGTNWLTSDRCDGTFVKVNRGVVEVNDIKKKKIVRVPAGKSYLATGTA
jgi:hypothetical protein